MTIHYIKNLNLPYSTSWWAFIFPLGAFVVGSHSLGVVLNFELIDYFGFGLFWSLLAIWIITLTKTTIHVFNQKESR